MRALKFAFVAVVAAIIVILSVANGGDVTVRLWPDLTAYALPASPTVETKLFIVGLACGIVGFLLGAMREYMREGSVRSAARRSKKEAETLKAKIDELTKSDDDDIPALPAR